MSKKKRIVRRKNINQNDELRKANKTLSGIHSKLFTEMIPSMKSFIVSQLDPFEKKINTLAFNLEQVKANVITLGTVLEDNQIIRKEDYMKTFDAYEKHIRGEIKEGKMVGTSVISIYNNSMEDSNENS